MLKLGDCVRLINGRAYSQHELLDTGTPVIRIQNLNGGDRWYYSDLTLPEDKYCHDGDLLFAWSASFGPYIWKGNKSIFHYHIWRVIPNESTDKAFAFRLLNWITAKVKAASHGVAMLHMTKAGMEAWLVPIPPLPEQRRIAAILEQADAIRAKRREALGQLDSLTQSIFVEMFGDPVANDRAWPLVAVSDFVAGFESGKSIVADDEDESESPFRVLKISAVTSLEYKPEHSKAVPSDYNPPASHIVRKGDLLFSRANTTELIGATAYVDETPDNLLLPDKLWRFVWFEKPRAAPLYVRHLFQQVKFRQEIGQRASGTSGSMQNISQPKVLSIRVGNPPLSLQQTFATRIQSIEALKVTHRAALQELDRLFASLQNRAFQGEL